MLTGQKIAKLRTEANLTQEQLAEKLYITRELVSKWETGKRNPDYKMILKSVLNTPLRQNFQIFLIITI